MENYVVYHVSYERVEYPSIRKYRTTKDFSWGFYCVSMKEYAEKRAEIYENAIINAYQLNNIELLYIKRFEGYTAEWLDFVMSCRSGSIHDYDVVIGPMADDTIYEYMDAYAVGQMNREKFFEEMREKYPVEQISFHTIQALNCMELVECCELDKRLY